MEKQLQDPFMWSMIMSSDKELSSHITVVLSLVCNKLFEEFKDHRRNKINKDSDDFIYQVCNLYLGTNKDGDYAMNVEYLWDKIQTTYTALYNWYKNPDTYHLIGLYIWLKEFKTRDFDNEKRFAILEKLMDEYENDTKDQFIGYLKKEIANIIHVDDTIKTKEGTIPWGLKYINYNDNPLQMIRILVTLNVEDVRTLQQDESARFPFHLLRKFNITSLEHIHPQNLILDNILLDTIIEWLRVKEESLKQINMFDKYKDDILKLKNFLQNESGYKDNKDEAQTIINRIDKEFDDLANMSEGQMHTLYNMALVDKETNSGLSNHLLDKKRELLRLYQEQRKTYVLPCTKKVFSKYYSPVRENNVLPKLWTTEDRAAYFDQIENVYNEFNSYYSID